MCLSGLLALSGYLQGASAEESTLPSNSLSTMSLDSQGFIYVAMLNTGNDEWGKFIDKFNEVITDSYLVFIDDYGVKGYYGSYSITQSGTLTQVSGPYISMNFADDETGSGTSGAVTLNNAPIVAMNTSVNTGIFGSYENKNIIDWDTAVRLYGRSVPSEYQEVIDAINGQYDGNGSDLGVESITPEVELKLGVLGFASDTLIQFVDLFNSENVNGTSLTFPAFSIDVEGQTYQVWNDYTFDLNTLYEEFSFLIDTVRTILTLFVWIAVFNYLVKEYERFVNG